MYCHPSITHKTRKEFQAQLLADHSVWDSKQVAQRCVQKEDGYATIVVARACGNINGVVEEGVG